MEKKIKQELEKLEEQEQIFWLQKSKVDWIAEGAETLGTTTWSQYIKELEGKYQES